MKRLFAVLVAIATLVVFSGCLQTETTVYLNRDGSGTIEQRFVMQADILSFIVGMGAASQGAAEGMDEDVQDFGFIDENELRDAAEGMGEGVRLKSVEAITEDGFSGYLAVYEFDDINEIRINQNPGEVVPSDGQEGSPVEYIEFDYRSRTLDIQFPSSLEDADLGDGGDSDESGGEAPGSEDIEMIKQIYSSLKIGIYLVAENGIASTNATYREGNTVTLMEMDFSKVLEDTEAFQELVENEPETIEEMKELIERVPGIKVETKDSITVRLN